MVKKTIKDFKIIFMGTPDFAVPALNALFNANYQIINIISQPNHAKGRKQIISDTPIAKFAKSKKLDLLHFTHFNVPILYFSPFVVTIHDLILTKFPSLKATLLSPWLYRLKNFAYRLVIKHAIKFSQKIIRTR